MEKIKFLILIIIIGIVSFDVFADWDLPGPKSIASYKATLSTQSIENISSYIIIESSSTWRKKFALEELSSRKTSESLDMLKSLENQLSKMHTKESMELCAKIEVDRIKRESKTEAERVQKLNIMLRSEKFFFSDAAALELFEIGGSKARQVLLAREKEGSNIAKLYRLKVEIKDLSTDEATDYLLDSIEKVYNLYGKKALKMISAERSCLQGLMFGDGKAFITKISHRQELLKNKEGNQSENDILFGQLLQQYSDQEKERMEKVKAYEERKKEKANKMQKLSQLSNDRKTEPVNITCTDEEIARIKTSIRERQKKEDWKAKEKKERCETLSKSKDRIKLKKAAKEFGDRNIAGTVDFSDAEKVEVACIVKNCLMLVQAGDGNDWESARKQIEGLWLAAVPELLNNIGHEDAMVSTLALKSLSLMRNEEIIRALIKMAKDTSDERRRMMAIIELGYMTEKRSSIVSGRQQNDTDAMKTIIEKEVRPLLRQLSETDKSAEIRKLATRSLKTLDEAPDRRLIQVQEKKIIRQSNQRRE
jgi:hypothetical protein